MNNTLPDTVRHFDPRRLDDAFYADPFPVEQHKFGPFGPIREFYAAQRAQNP